MNIDQGCGHAILSTMSFLTKSGTTPIAEMLHFANSLVYDEMKDICYAFDPRDDYKRRLEKITEEECNTYDCFNCAYTGGKCQWDVAFNECMKPQKPLENKRWWEWYSGC